jgi:D-alanyl-D-alanine carboxypeptidase
VFVFLGYLAWNEHRAYIFQKTITELETTNEIKSEELTTLKASSTESSATVHDLFTTLARVIDDERAKSKSLEDKVGTLDKLSKSDPQLLKKYSKVYFLNENYAPVSLATIPSEYIFNKKTVYQVHTEMMYFLQRLLDDARTDGMDLLVISAYRSFATQVNVKAVNKVTYGAGTANQFSAEQGFSEHQLGTTVDFTTGSSGANFMKFEGTKEFTWLKTNAHKYGFTLSYPKGNKYYAYEPWHWRFIGADLATTLHADEKYFFDLDQKVIDGYLIKMFDR